MKLCIPSLDDRGLESQTVEHFGRAPWFTFVDTDSGAVESRVNPSCHTHPGVCQHVDLLRALHVDAVAGVQVGRRAWQGLLDAGIEVFAAPAARVGDVVAAVKTGSVVAIDSRTACGGHGHGHGHGDACGHGHGHGHEHGHEHRHGQGSAPGSGHGLRRRQRQREG